MYNIYLLNTFYVYYYFHKYRYCCAIFIQNYIRIIARGTRILLFIYFFILLTYLEQPKWYFLFYWKKNLQIKLFFIRVKFFNRKMHEFYQIVRPVILPQLIVASFTIISLSYIITLVILKTNKIRTRIVRFKNWHWCKFVLVFYFFRII